MMKLSLSIFICAVFHYYLVFAVKFEPYCNNGGTIVGIAGRNFCIIASDTRLSEGRLIRSRNQSRVVKLGHGFPVHVGGHKCSGLLASAGCFADGLGLANAVRSQVKRYEYAGGGDFSDSNDMYVTTSQNDLQGVHGDEHPGASIQPRLGCLYRFDAVGSSQRLAVTSAGSGESIIQPLLDQSFSGKESDDSQDIPWSYSPSQDSFESRALHHVPSSTSIEDMAKYANIFDTSQQSDDTVVTHDTVTQVQRTKVLVLNAFIAANKREISIGDGVQMWIWESTPTRTISSVLPKSAGSTSGTVPTGGRVDGEIDVSDVYLPLSSSSSSSKWSCTLTTEQYSLPKH